MAGGSAARASRLALAILTLVVAGGGRSGGAGRGGGKLGPDTVSSKNRRRWRRRGRRLSTRPMRDFLSKVVLRLVPSMTKKWRQRRLVQNKRSNNGYPRKKIPVARLHPSEEGGTGSDRAGRTTRLPRACMVLMSAASVRVRTTPAGESPGRLCGTRDGTAIGAGSMRSGGLGARLTCFCSASRSAVRVERERERERERESAESRSSSTHHTYSRAPYFLATAV